jgi:hypothetical protein
MKGYPLWFTARKIHLVMLALALSGVLLVPTTLNSYLEMDVSWRLSSNARILVTAMHVALSFLGLLLIGALWSIHIRSGWRKRQARVSGVVMLTGLALLTLTSLPVLYASHETLVSISALAHAGVGSVLVIPYLLHVIVRRKK